MRFLAVISLVFLMASCSMQPDQPPSPCYQCIIRGEIERCDTVEYYTIIEDLKCGWSEEEILQYEKKNTFVLEEKCFNLRQYCICVNSI